MGTTITHGWHGSYTNPVNYAFSGASPCPCCTGHNAGGGYTDCMMLCSNARCFVGKHWSDGNAKVVSEALVELEYTTNAAPCWRYISISQSCGTVDVVFELRASNAAPDTDPGAGVLLASCAAKHGPSCLLNNTVDLTTPYAYHWIANDHYAGSNVMATQYSFVGA